VKGLGKNIKVSTKSADAQARRMQSGINSFVKKVKKGR
jgi:hypothetical protein